MSSVQPARHTSPRQHQHSKRSDIFHHASRGPTTTAASLHPLQHPLLHSATHTPTSLSPRSVSQSQHFASGSAAQQPFLQTSDTSYGRRSRDIFNHRSSSPRDAERCLSADGGGTGEEVVGLPSSRKSSGQWGTGHDKVTVTAPTPETSGRMSPEDLPAPTPSQQPLVAGGGWPSLPKRPRPSLHPSVDAFSAAISQMYSGRTANPLLSRHGLSGPISVEQLRSRTSSTSSQASRRGPLRADHSLHTPRSANDREIEEINRRAAQTESSSRQRVASHRPLSAQLHPTYHTDLTDDTAPDNDNLTTPCSPGSHRSHLSHPDSARRRRVYLIKRPHSAPVYGRISPASARSEYGGRASGRSSVERGATPTAALDVSKPAAGVNATQPQGSGVPNWEERHNGDVRTTRLLGLEQVPTETEDRVSHREGWGEPGSSVGVTAKRGRHESPVSFPESDPDSRRCREQSGHVQPVCQSANINSSDQSAVKSCSTSVTTQAHIHPVGDPHTVQRSASSQPRSEAFFRHDHNDLTQNDLGSELRGQQRFAQASETVSVCVSGQQFVEGAQTPQPALRTVISQNSSSQHGVLSRSVEDTHSSSFPANPELETRASSFPQGWEGHSSVCSGNSVAVNSAESRSGSGHLGVSNQNPSDCDPAPTKSLCRTVPKSAVPTSPTASAFSSPHSSPYSSPSRTIGDSKHVNRISDVESSPLLCKKPVTHGESGSVPSNLEWSGLKFSSVDSLLVGVDAETVSSPKKTKNKKSRLKSWFTSRKGKYNPGNESIPVIESPWTSLDSATDLPANDEPQLSPNSDASQESGLGTRAISHPTLNTNANSSHLIEQSAPSQALAPTSRVLTNIMDKQVTQPPSSQGSGDQDGEATSARSKASTDLSGKLPQHAIEDPKAAEIRKTFSLVSSEVLKGSSSGAYENTNLTFNKNVSRHEMITIQGGSSLGTFDKRVVLNDSGFPEDLGSTLRARPVMVMERKLSPGGGGQDHPTVRSFSRQGSDSSSSLSFVEMDADGTMTLSQTHGSAEDLELLTKASRIVQAQKSDGLLTDGQDDEHELVVIREYVFAAKKSSVDGGTPRSDTGSESRGVSSATPQALDSQDDSPGELSCLTSTVKEEDSGLDSPPSLQDCVSASDARGEGDSIVINRLKADPTHAVPSALPGRSDNNSDRTPKPQAFINRMFSGGDTESSPPVGGGQMSGPSEESSQPADAAKMSSPSLTKSRTLHDEGAASHHSQNGSSLPGSDASFCIPPSREGTPPLHETEVPHITPLCEDAPYTMTDQTDNFDNPHVRLPALPGTKREGHDQDKTDGMLSPTPSSTMTTTTTMTVPQEAALSANDDETAGRNRSPSIGAVYAIPSKPQKGSLLQSGPKSGDSDSHQAESPQLTTSPSTTESKAAQSQAEVVPATDGGVQSSDNVILKERIEVMATSALQSVPNSRQAVGMATGRSGVEPKVVEKSPRPSTRSSRYRDSLTEEEYHKPWGSDFSSIEDSIRSRITSAFPSSGGEEEANDDGKPSEESQLSDTSPSSAGTSSPSLTANKTPEAPTHDNRKISTDRKPSDVKRQDSQPETDSPPQLPDAEQTEKHEMEENATEYADLQYSLDSTKTNKEATTPVTAKLSSSQPSPRKISDRSERPPLPLPPSPPSAKPAVEEGKSGPEEKAGKLKAEGRASPVPHTTLKDKFRKVFSHSMDDKKAAKAENKKIYSKAQKKGPLPVAEEDAANKSVVADLDHKHKSSPAGQRRAQPSTGKGKAPSLSRQDTPDTVYMLPELTATDAKPTENQKDAKLHHDSPDTTYVDEVRLPFSPKEAKKLIKAEKKNAARLQQEEGRDASSTDESKISSPKAPNKALKWIKKKLATKGKKAPRTKKYDVNAPEGEEEGEVVGNAMVGREEEALSKVSDANSASEESHSSDSSSDSGDNDEEEQKRKKMKKRTPFFAGKKGNKKHNQKKTEKHESDSDTSAEESRARLFSWSLGRKKAADSSDHEDNLPASYKHSADLNLSEDTAGVSGTFRKISQSDIKPSWGASQTASTPPTSGKQLEDSKEQPGAGSQKCDDDDTHNKKDSHKTSPGLTITPAAAKLFALDDDDEEDVVGKGDDSGDYARLRQEATVQGKGVNRSKLPRPAGYELAKPLFLHDSDSARNISNSSVDDSESPGTSLDKTEDSQSVDSIDLSGCPAELRSVRLKSKNDETPEDTVSEDVIVPVKAARPVNQAFKASMKHSKENLVYGDMENITESAVKQKPATNSKPATTTKPSPPTIKPVAATNPRSAAKETENGIVVFEDEIIPCKAEDVPRGHSLRRKPSPKKRGNKNPSAVSSTEGYGDNIATGSPTTLHHKVVSAAQKSLPVLNAHVTAAAATDSPRSTADSDDSAGGTYLDGPGFLDTAKASWNLQSNSAGNGPPDPDSSVEQSPSVPRDTENKIDKKTGSPQVAVRKTHQAPQTDSKADDSQTIQKPPEVNTGDHGDRKDAQQHNPVVPTDGLQQPEINDLDRVNNSPGRNNGKSSQSPADAKQSVSTVPENKLSGSNRRITRAVKPSDLLGARKHEDGAKNPSKIAEADKKESLTDGMEQSPSIDWLDSHITNSEPGHKLPPPKKPKPTTSKPEVSQKPAGVKLKEADSPSPTSKPKVKPGAVPRKMVSKEETIIPSAAVSVLAEQKNENRTDTKEDNKPGTETLDVHLRSHGLKNPEPKPRFSVSVLKDNDLDRSADGAQRYMNAHETPVALSRTNKMDTEAGETADNSDRGFSGLSSPLCGDSTTHSDEPSTSSWPEGESSLGPAVGDFTLSLDPHTERSEKVIEAYSTATFKRPSADTVGRNHQTPLSASRTQDESDLTNVTPLSDICGMDTSTPLQTANPRSQSTPLSAADVTGESPISDLTLTSVSAIPAESASIDPTVHKEEEIYEPIFFDDLNDPRCARRLTEAPPVRPEKVGKRNAEPATTAVNPDFDDDQDNMYDVPPSRRQFEFPKESSFPVMSFVDKRGSKALPKPDMTFEPEDTILPYATCHRTSLFIKQDSNYGDDENPYMNDGEDFQALSKEPSSKTDTETDEQVHACLSELFPKDVKGEAGEQKDCEPGDSVKKSEKVEETESTPQSEPDTKESTPIRRKSPVSEDSADKQINPETSTSQSSRTSSDRDSSSEAGAGRVEDKHEKGNEMTEIHDGTISDKATGKKSDEDDKEKMDDDHYLKSPEYKKSVDEIDKLYAALEREEAEMEKQSSQRDKQRTPAPVGRLLSFEEQRAELKPLKRSSREDSDLHQQPTQNKPETGAKPKPTKPKPVRTSKKGNKMPEQKGNDKSSSEPVLTDTTACSTMLEAPKTPAQEHSTEFGEKEDGQAEQEPVPQQQSESRSDSKTGEQSPQTVLPLITGYNKLLDTAVHVGQDQQLKVKPDEVKTSHADGAEGGPERKALHEREDFSSFKLDLPPTSLEAEAMRQTMYAQVMKGSSMPEVPVKPEASEIAPDPQQGTSEPPEPKEPRVSETEHEAPGPEPTVTAQEAKELKTTVTPPKASKTSTFTALFGSRQVKRPAPVARPDKSPRADTKPQPSLKISRSPRFGVKPPKPPKRGTPQDSADADNSAEQQKPSADKDNTTAVTGDKPATDNADISLTEKTPVSKDSCVHTSSTTVVESHPPPPGQPQQPPPVPAPKPAAQGRSKPRPKPRDSANLSALPGGGVGASELTPSDTKAVTCTEQGQAAAPERDAAPSPKMTPRHARTVSQPAGHSAGLSTRGPDDEKKDRRCSEPSASAASDSTDEEDGSVEGEEGEEEGSSPPLPERQYKKKKGKYNEYSNVIRVDSQRLKDARGRSQSKPNLASEDGTDISNSNNNSGRLRNAVSMEGGLDKKSAKKAKKARRTSRDGQASGEEDKRHKKPFLFRSLRDLFGSKKKKAKDGKDVGEGDWEADNVYEVVEDKNDPATKSKKEAADKKHTWPKQQKRKKSDQGSQPATSNNPPSIEVDSSHDSKDIRPIGRLLQLNPDGTQLLELIRPPNGNLGVQLTQGNEEMSEGKFVSGFVDKGTEKLLSGILSIGDQILKINDRPVDHCALIEVHDIIDTQQRLKFLVYPADHN